MKIEELRKELKKNHKVLPFNEKRVKGKKINNVYNNKLKIIGITGSRGKSTTAYILHKYLKKMGYESVLYSSIEIDSKLSFGKRHSAIDNPIKNKQMLLNAIEQAIGIDADFLILEINERAIKQGIIDDVPFDVRVLTNIVEKQNEVFYPDYVDIKKRFLLEANEEAKLILCVNDQITYNLYKEIANKNLSIITSRFIAKKYNILEKDVNFLIKSNEHQFDSIEGINFDVIINENSISISSDLFMSFNTFNITCVIGILRELNIFNSEKFIKFIKHIEIPGRNDIIKYKNRVIIVSVNLVPHLEYLNKYKLNKEINEIIIVTGATGLGFETWIKEYSDELYEKDKELSLNFAYKYICNHADKLYLTVTDSGATNIEELLKRQENLIVDIEYEVIKDRKEAIAKAMKNSKEHDVIFISGRGNREIMCNSVNTITLFNDLEVVKQIIKEEGDL